MNTINNPVQTMLQNLAFKATVMTSYRQQKALMDSIAYATYNPDIPANIRAQVRAAIQNGDEKANRQFRSEAKSAVIPVDQQVYALENASPMDKRKLLDTLPIIPVPVGAAFLGVAEADLRALNSQSGGVFGDLYMRRQCNSMNELLLIAQNPGWLGYRPDGAPPLMSPDAEMLYAITYVDIWTAMAYTNMGWREVKAQVDANGRYFRYERTYRVSDLEDMRVAKLKARQQ